MISIRAFTGGLASITASWFRTTYRCLLDVRSITICGIVRYGLCEAAAGIQWYRSHGTDGKCHCCCACIFHSQQDCHLTTVCGTSADVLITTAEHGGSTCEKIRHDLELDVCSDEKHVYLIIPGSGEITTTLAAESELTLMEPRRLDQLNLDTA